MLKEVHILTLVLEITVKILNLKLIQISKYKSIFAKGCSPDWYEHWTFYWTFYEKE